MAHERKIQVELDSLPSKGKIYPEGLQIFVHPLTAREQMALADQTINVYDYYTKLLEGVDLVGAIYPKTELLFNDLEYLDLRRRLFSFGDNTVVAKVPCVGMYKGDCDQFIEYKFKVSQIEFYDYPKEVLNQVTIEGDGTYIGKEYTFTDGTRVIASPLTVGQYLNQSKKYVSSPRSYSVEKAEIGFLTECIKHIVGREFKEGARQEFLDNYLGDELYDTEDIETLTTIMTENTSLVKPFETECEKCKSITEVFVMPTTTFRKER